jgi:hypothetical protein
MVYEEIGIAMNTNITTAINTNFMKVITGTAIAAVLVELFWRSSTGPHALLNWIVWLGAIIVFAQAIRAGRYPWAVVFGALAVLLNPILPVPISASYNLLLNAITFILFIVSLEVLRAKPRLTIASIMDRRPGRDAL